MIESLWELLAQVFVGQMPFLSPNQQCQSTQGKVDRQKLIDYRTHTQSVVQRLLIVCTAATADFTSGFRRLPSCEVRLDTRVHWAVVWWRVGFPDVTSARRCQVHLHVWLACWDEATSRTVWTILCRRSDSSDTFCFFISLNHLSDYVLLAASPYYVCRSGDAVFFVKLLVILYYFWNKYFVYNGSEPDCVEYLWKNKNCGI